MTQQSVESALSEMLGTTNFVWSSGASPEDCYRLGDATDFHIDLAARFVGRRTVLANSTDDMNDPRKPFMDRHLEELRASFFSSRRRHTSCLSDWSSDVCSSD